MDVKNCAKYMQFPFRENFNIIRTYYLLFQRIICLFCILSHPGCKIKETFAMKPKKLFSAVTAAVMAISLLPLSAFSEGTGFDYVKLCGTNYAGETFAEVQMGDGTASWPAGKAPIMARVSNQTDTGNAPTQRIILGSNYTAGENIVAATVWKLASDGNSYYADTMFVPKGTTLTNDGLLPDNYTPAGGRMTLDTSKWEIKKS